MGLSVSVVRVWVGVGVGVVMGVGVGVGVVWVRVGVGVGVGVGGWCVGVWVLRGSSFAFWEGTASMRGAVRGSVKACCRARRSGAALSFLV